MSTDKHNFPHILVENKKSIFVASDGNRQVLTLVEVLMYNVGVYSLEYFEKLYSNYNQRG